MITYLIMISIVAVLAFVWLSSKKIDKYQQIINNIKSDGATRVFPANTEELENKAKQIQETLYEKTSRTPFRKPV